MKIPKRITVRLLALVAPAMLAVAAMSGCSDPIGVDPPPHADDDANKWIYEKMQDVYLYDHIYPIDNVNYNQSCETFFPTILSDAAADNDGKTRNGAHVFYSWFERTAGSKAMAAVGHNSYGFEYIAYNNFIDENKNPLVLARVLYVMPNSPAARGGLERGDWIHSFNDTRLNMDNYQDIASGAAVKFTVWKGQLLGSSVMFSSKGTVNVGASAAIDTNPVYLDTVYTEIAAGNVGYLVYNAFSTSPDGGGYIPDGIYMKALRDAFAGFKAGNVDHLVLDLRYNPGGYVEVCRLLSSLISQKNLGKRFATLKYNGKITNRSYDFYKDSEVPENLGLDRVYVLTSPWTASASELLINTLRPYGIEVVLIGTATEGKNVGSQEYSSTKYGLTLHPIVCRIYNSEDRSDYRNGFAPDHMRDEIRDYSQLLPLGDTDEPLLKTAIDLINGVSASAGAGTKADDGITVLPPSFAGRGTRGAIVTE